MNIETFDQLLAAARAQPTPQRLLMVFAGAELPADASPGATCGLRGRRGR